MVYWGIGILGNWYVAKLISLALLSPLPPLSPLVLLSPLLPRPHHLISIYFFLLAPLAIFPLLVLMSHLSSTTRTYLTTVSVPWLIF